MTNAKPYSLSFGHYVAPYNVLKSVKFFASFEEAMSKALEYKNLASVDKYTLIQVGTGDSAIAMRYDTKSTVWSVINPCWTKEQIDKERSNVYTVKLKNLKGHTWYLFVGWGGLNLVGQQLKNKFGAEFVDEKFRVSDNRRFIEWDCKFPEDKFQSAKETLERCWNCILEQKEA